MTKEKKPGEEQAVIGDVRRVQNEDSDEAWERDIDDEDDGEVRGVDATLIHYGGGWNVTVTMMEFVRGCRWKVSFAAGSTPRCVSRRRRDGRRNGNRGVVRDR